MVRLLAVFLFFSLYCNGQQQMIPSTVPNKPSASGTLTPSYIDSVSIEEILPVSTKTPTMVFGNTDAEVTLNGKAWNNGVEVDAVFSWTIKNIETGVVSGPFLGQSFSEFLAEGTYSPELSAVNLNTKTVNAIASIDVEKPVFTEGEADLVIDMTQVRNSTWSNPLGNLTVTQGTNAVFDFQGVTRNGFKIALKNNFSGNRTTWKGLKASSEANEIRIQNVGSQVVFTSTGSSNCMLFSDNNQYILIDGRGVGGTDYGFKFVGRTTAGTQSQLVYFIGEAIRGIKIRACDFDGNRGQGATDGGPALQWNTNGADDTASAGYNWDNWDGDYFKAVGLRFTESWDEDLYISHTSNAIDASGYRPPSPGDVWVLSCTFNQAGRNHIQFAGTTSSLIVNNYGIDSGLEGTDGQNQAISQNDGNRGNNYIMRNYFEECDMFLVITNGYQGTGNYYYIDNVGIQRASVLSGTLPQFIFYNVEDLASCHAVFANNTWKCPNVTTAPLCIQYDNTSFTDLTFGFYNNVISTGGTDQSFAAELRTVNTASTNRTGWVVSNTFRRTAQQSQLKLNNLWRPHDTTAPLFNAGISLTPLSLPMEGDIDGQTLSVNSGISEGAFGGEKLFTP